MYFYDTSSGVGVQFDGSPNIPHKDPSNRVNVMAEDGTVRSYTLPRDKEESWSVNLIAITGSVLQSLKSFWSLRAQLGATAIRWYRDSDSSTGSYETVRIISMDDTQIGYDMHNVSMKLTKEL
jgi:hypothetical protein